MGTNYYWYECPPCSECGHEADPLHVGKSSSGWCFSLHIYPELGIETLDDWVDRWGRYGSEIRDESLKRVYPDEMRRIVTDREGLPDPLTGEVGFVGEWWKRHHPQYQDEEHFHLCNSSVRGPLGLVRCRLIEGICVGHGEGTWDLFIGDFS